MNRYRLIWVALLTCGFYYYASSQEPESEGIVSEYTHSKVMITDPGVKFLLDNDLSETSGLIFYRDALWTHNDSGNDPVIYKVDTANGSILQKVTLEGAENVDWEDITQDAKYIYVGDFGNNRGSRKDLKIYRILKERIPEEGDADVRAEVINFYFSDQESFEDKNRANDYDCESVISSGGFLYLFSKNWVDGNTRLYQLPSTPGSHEAVLTGEFRADGLVTGATINPQGNRLALIGYRNFTPFIWLFRKFGENDFFGGDSVRVDLPHLMGSQTEGIAFTDSVNLMISCEKMATEQQVFTTNTLTWENGPRDDIQSVSVSNWEYTIIEKKKKHTRLLAVDLSTLRGHTYDIWIETVLQREAVPFHSYGFEKHMGKIYLEMDIYTFASGKYNVVVGAGSMKDEKQLVLTKF